jgi:hypothetical protein
MKTFSYSLIYNSLLPSSLRHQADKVDRITLVFFDDALMRLLMTITSLLLSTYNLVIKIIK